LGGLVLPIQRQNTATHHLCTHTTNRT